MKKVLESVLSLFLSSVVLFGISTTVHATLNIEVNVDVPVSCNVTDTDGVTHNYPQIDSPNSYFAICALETAINNGFISGAQLSNQFPSLGLFITAINNVVADPNSQYWAIYQNGSLANFGLTSLLVATGDVIVLQLHDFSDNNLGDQVTLNIHSLNTPMAPTPASRGKIGKYIPPTFNVENAMTYLKSVQNADGSFGGADLYTDWAAIAYGAFENYDSSRDLLLSYFNSHTTLSKILTDNERHAMALLSLGQNPYSFNDVNYIEAIIKTFDDGQFGDPTLVNDDVFALIPLTGAGYTANDEIILKDISFIVAKQKTDGSWEGSADLTGAAVQALYPFISIDGVAAAISNASLYLQNTQNNDGGWGSVYSTSWAMQGADTLRLIWTKNGHAGLDYLAITQAEDGATLSSNEALQNRIWATSYAIPAALGKPWSAIFKMVQKPAQTNIDQNNNIDNKKITEKIKNGETRKEKTVAQKTEIPRIIENPQIKNTLAASAAESENQISKSFVKILPLAALLLLAFALW